MLSGAVAAGLVPLSGALPSVSAAVADSVAEGAVESVAGCVALSLGVSVIFSVGASAGGIMDVGAYAAPKISFTYVLSRKSLAFAAT